MTYFGTNIKKIRQIKGLSQQAFAELLELNRGVISSYEEGRAEPKIESLLKIAKILNLTTDDLLSKPVTINKITNFSEIEHLIPNKERENVSVYELDKTNHFQNFDLQKILASLSFVYKVDEQLAQKSMYTEGSYLLLAKLNQESISKNQNYLCFQNGQFEITGEINSAENAYLIIGEIQSKGRKRRDLQSILDRLEKVEKALENIKKD